MGTWGVGLYSDDDACDVRAGFREAIGDGLDAPAATDRLLHEWGSSTQDEVIVSPFWLALADTQWKLGRLEERVRDKALALIDTGQDLARWADAPRDRKKRAAILEGLKTQLLSPQSLPKRVPKRFQSECDWAVGEVIAFQRRSGRTTLFRVIGHHEDRGGRSPICEILDWDGAPGAVPFPGDIDRATVVRGAWWSQVMLGATSPRSIPLQRVHRLETRSTPSQAPGRFLVVLWRGIDKALSEMAGLS
jgi:hypothetical protein